MKAMGVKRGVPDFLLPFPSPKGQWIGLAVELKSKKGKLSPEQEQWLKALGNAGWMASVVRDIDGFVETVLDYVDA